MVATPNKIEQFRKVNIQKGLLSFSILWGVLKTESYHCFIGPMEAQDSYGHVQEENDEFCTDTSPISPSSPIATIERLMASGSETTFTSCGPGLGVCEKRGMDFQFLGKHRRDEAFKL